MKSEYDTQFECYNHYWEDGDQITTFGGESYIDDYEFDEYGIQCDDMQIWHIPSSGFKKLAVRMINHLMVNGHEFKFLNDAYNGNHFGKK